MKGKKYKWDSVSVSINGEEIHGITEIKFKYSLNELHDMLIDAEEKEEYELCAEIKNKIDNYKY